MARVRILILTIFCALLFSQPNWTYNPNDFGDTGSITSIVNINDTQVGGPSDLLGAFSGEICRGFTEGTSTPSGYYFFLTVYGEYGEILDFKYYDAAIDLIYPITETADFSPNMILGDYSNPLVLNSSSDQIPDCNGVYGGTAFIDNCGICSSGNTGHLPDSDMDCMGICFGPNILDEFSECCESPPTWFLDSDGDGLGYILYYIEACTVPTGYVGNSDDNYPNCQSNLVDCAGTCDGIFLLDIYGNCCAELTTWYSDSDGDGLGNPDVHVESCNQPSGYIDNADDLYPACSSNIVDCLGVCDGSASLDVCGDCNGNGSSCADCQGIPNGSAFLDDCGICSGGLTGHIPNSNMDCFGECFGSAGEDPLGVCCNDLDMDCAGYCFGNHGTILWAGNEYYYPSGENEPYDFQEIWINAESYPILDADVVVRLSIDDWTSFVDIPMNSETGPDWPNNVHYYANVGTFTAGTNLQYVIHIVSCTEWWLNDNGNNYQISINDSDNDDDGLLNWDDPYPDCAANVIDCAGDCGGEAVVDDCGYCTGGTTGLTPNYADLGCGCEIAGPNSYCVDIDDDGLGAGTPEVFCEADVPIDYVLDCTDTDDNCTGNIYDCAGICNGSAFIDDCGICSEGTTSHIANSDQDCEGTCDGSAITDDCGECSGGNTGHLFNSDMDCNGDCFGTASTDFCEICSGGNSGHEANIDIDNCGVCFGNDSEMDCAGVCFGLASLDQCAVCAGGTTGVQPGQDEDECGVCFGENADMDCNGDCFGSALLDDCNVCTGGNTGLTANYLMDCAGVCGGEAVIDDCGVCSGGSTGLIVNEGMDCTGECFGIAALDECNVCSGGNSGIIPNSDIDECGICFGPGLIQWYFDGDFDGLGDPDNTLYACNEPENYVSNPDDLYPNCNVNLYDEFGICGGDNTLQGAIDSSEPGATITVPADIYSESIIINKPLTITGLPGATLTKSDVTSIVSIQSNDVTVQNLIIETEESVTTGIRVNNGYRRISILNNTIRSSIELTLTNPVNLSGITINGHEEAPDLGDYVIQNNTIENVNIGIKLNTNSHQSVLEQNVIQNLAQPNPVLVNSPYPIGIQCVNSSNVQFLQNNILNTGIGFYLISTTGTSQQNTFQDVNIFAIHDETTLVSSSGFPDFARATLIFPDLPLLYGYFADLQEAFVWAEDGTIVYWNSNGEITEYVQDCSGIWDGLSTIDNCNTCDDNPDNDCIEDCTGLWGGTAII
ncbi:MAG: hypothetical protein HQ510_12045, partial [Candidatus Marinimicrobia bacterium]|nr:hypothetical protein [Candidatus Neomarinimicrobiota bacterium]